MKKIAYILEETIAGICVKLHLSLVYERKKMRRSTREEENYTDV